MYIGIMSEISMLKSFVVRVYRHDPDQPSKVTGVIEPLDGSGDKRSFTDTSEMNAILGAILTERDKKGGSATLARPGQAAKVR